MWNIFKIFSKKKPATTNAPDLRVVLDSSKLCKMISYFPIGNSVKYYPEYREEVILDTDVNKLILNGTTIDEVNSFAVLIPPETRGETGLDYERKEILGKSGGFSKGNSITLVGKEKDGKISTIDTVVSKYARLKEGYYNDTQVVVLNVDPALLVLKDQRTQKRLEAQIPGLIQTKLYTEHNQCTIVDFSEHTIKITCDDNEIVAMSCHKGESVTLTFDLPNSTEPNIMRGKVLRTEGASMIIELTDILITETFEKLEPIDLIEIKAKLLQQPRH